MGDLMVFLVALRAWFEYNFGNGCRSNNRFARAELKHLSLTVRLLAVQFCFLVFLGVFQINLFG